MQPHVCRCDADFLRVFNLPPHQTCTRDEEEDSSVYYALYWAGRVTCVYQKDGPATIMDYRGNPQSLLYPGIKEALGPLSAILANV